MFLEKEEHGSDGVYVCQHLPRCVWQIRILGEHFDTLQHFYREWVNFWERPKEMEELSGE